MLSFGNDNDNHDDDEDDISVEASIPPHKRDNPLLSLEMKELQRVIAVFCHDSNCEDMTAKDQERILYETFHGQNGKASQLELLVKGSNPYLKLYDELPCQSELHPESDVIVQRCLKKICSPNGGTKQLLTGPNQAINVGTLRCSTRTGQLLTSGRLLLSMAKDAIRHGKKALSFAHRYLSDGKLPSGKTLDDLLHFVRQEMWVADGNDETTLTDQWIFPGYISFVIFACPIINDDQQRLSVFCINGEKEGKKASRATARKRKAKENNDQRLAHPINPGKRGLTHQQQFQLGQNKIAALQLEINQERKSLFSTTMILENTIKNVVAEQRGLIMNLKDYKSLGLMDEFNKAVLDLGKCSTLLADLRNERLSIRAEKKTHQLKIAEKQELVYNLLHQGDCVSLSNKHLPHHTQSVMSAPKIAEVSVLHCEDETVSEITNCNKD